MGGALTPDPSPACGRGELDFVTMSHGPDYEKVCGAFVIPGSDTGIYGS